jgi:hypothetical protein
MKHGRIIALGATFAIAVACCKSASTPAGTTAGGGSGGSGAGGMFEASSSSSSSSGCADAGAIDGSMDCDGLDGSASYTNDVLPIFQMSCGGELCHVPPSRDALVGIKSNECCDGRELIAPGDPAHSYLIDKLRGERLCSGGSMPLGQTPLDPAQIATITAWVCGGAQP